MRTTAHKSLTLTDIVLMNVVAVASLRWIASAASNGPSSLVWWIAATLLFFVPEGLAVASLSSRFNEEGGLYRWTQRAFGDGHGFLCGWCYWVNNLVYFPGMLLYVAANLAFALQWLRPDWRLEHNKLFVVSVTLLILWMIGLLSLIGMKAGKWLQNLGALGNWIPAVAIAILGGMAFHYYGSANPLTAASLTPHWDIEQFGFFSQMCFALAGLELVSFMGGEIDEPRKTIARGLWLAGLVILSVYFLGTLGILVAVPKAQITPINGILLPLVEMGQRLAVSWCAGICAALICLGAIGTTMAWFAGVSRVPYVVGIDSYLPRSFARLHPRFQTPFVAIGVQTLVATVLTLFATAGASTGIESAYLVMIDMCLILYFIPYCYLFLCLLFLPPGYRLGLGRISDVTVGVIGLTTTVFAIAVTTIPSKSVEWSTTVRGIIGALILLGLGGAVYARARRFRLRGAIPHRLETGA